MARMTDAELRALVTIPLDNALEELSQEVKRARAAELALTARLTELEAAAAGMTGTPDYEGLYWCEAMHSIGSAPWRGHLEWRSGQWWQHEFDGRRIALSSGARVAFQRLFTEDYTPTEKPHDT